MIIIRNGAKPPPQPWWHGLRIECPKCTEVVMLQKGDQDRASIGFEINEYGHHVSYRCENCGNITTRRQHQ